ncbi:MAG: hypothetical protein IJ348_07155 [Alistipes sp.]|nr:hypothetical protein [Alistipes sp.]
MNKNPLLRGGESAYLAPDLEVTYLAPESGFQASLPYIDTEEGDPWEEFEDNEE